MRRTFLKIALFAGFIVLMIAGLKFLHWLPNAIQNDTLRAYASIDEVKERLQFEDLAVPAYFPETIAWPPSSILAQKRPFPAVVMEFRETKSDMTGLLITEAEAGRLRAGGNFVMTRIQERAEHRLRGRTAILEVGTCGGRGSCSRMSWQHGRLRIMVLMLADPFELIRLSESMLD